MKHVLLTRFAIRWPEGSPRRRWEEREGWVDYRINLFKKYCLPSVQAQTFKDFDWWLLIDPTFPGITWEHIVYLQRCAKLLWVKDPIVIDQLNEGKLLSHVYKNEWVCSTRFDSDDILRNDFMERLNRIAVEEEMWITFKYGYMMKDGEIAPKQYTRNPFVSYVEYASPFRSVYSEGHKHVHRQKAPLEIIEDVPGWIQVDHGDNIKNLVSRKMKNFKSILIDPSTIHQDFTWNRNGS